MSRQHYVFGYGSLICAESRAATASALGEVAGSGSSRYGSSIPVRLNNWVRLWNLRGPNTYLGVHNSSSAQSSCVGVLVPLPSSKQNDSKDKNNINYNDSKNYNDEVLEALDRRERGYNRHRVDLSLIERVDDLLRTTAAIAEAENGSMTSRQAVEDRYYKNTFLRRNATATTHTNDDDDDEDSDEKCKNLNDIVCIWIYVPKDRYAGMACSRKPILQSYVDICLRGCLSISESFAREFIESTYGWFPGHSHLQITTDDDDDKKEGYDSDSGPDADDSGFHCWINDRETPVYVRADKKFSIDNSETLDAIFDPVLLGRRRR